MKKLSMVLFVIILSICLLQSQVPQKMSYQAVVRNATNNLVVNTQVSLRISIIQGTVSNTPVYVETQSATTNDNGLLSIEIGGGTVVLGTFSDINWYSGIYFIKTETDLTGGTNYTITGTSQLLSVPFAFYAKTAESISSYAISQQAPMITELAPTNILEFSADLNSKINGKGFLTNVSFEWGLTTSYGNSVIPSQSPISGITDVDISSNIKGLQSGTTYHFRVKASNAVNVTYSPDMTFTTGMSTPQLTTISATSITAFSAISGGNVSYDGGSSVTARGICWNTSSSPTIELSTKTNDGTGTGLFNSNITGLINNKVYYVRSYATNAAGTTYGNEISFTTKNGIVALITTSPTSITTNSCTSGGSITNDGGAAITARGLCWSTSPNPTLANNKSTSTGEIGTYATNISGLNIGTTYYLRAYATNAVGTYYGNEISFSTLDGKIIINTVSVSNITLNSAQSGGNIISDGALAVTERGVCWSTNQIPTIENNRTTDSNGSGSFTSNISGLVANTTYYVRAYATNAIGTGYGNVMSFKTGAVMDIDGNVYHSVTIGTQTWTVENLKTTRYNDGTFIQNVTDDANWQTLNEPAYCWYNNDAVNKSTYGALYNWYAVHTGKLCPIGWHIPTDKEWTILVNYLIANGYNYDGTTTEDLTAKSLAATTNWDTETGAGRVGNTDFPAKRNSSGFTALPGGYRSKFYYGMGMQANWWCSNEASSSTAYVPCIVYYYIKSYTFSYTKYYGLSVRCIKD